MGQYRCMFCQTEVEAPCLTPRQAEGCARHTPIEQAAANDRQIGGEHYKQDGGQQHWDFVAKHQLNYFIGCATKYVSRWRKKGGVEDLRKAVHFIDKLLEIWDSNMPVPPPKPIPTAEEIMAFSMANDLSVKECAILNYLCGLNDKIRFEKGRNLIQELIDAEVVEDKTGMDHPFGWEPNTELIFGPTICNCHNPIIKYGGDGGRCTLCGLRPAAARPSISLCQCEDPTILCDENGCRCTLCGLPERMGI